MFKRITSIVTAWLLVLTALFGVSAQTAYAAEDTTAPKVTSTSPKAGAVGVNPESSVSITFDENIVQGPNFSGVKLTDSAGKNHFYYDTYIRNNQLNLWNMDFMRAGSVYTVTVPAGAVQDAAGNLNETYTMTFSTMAYLGVMNSSLSGQTTVDPTAPITLTFNMPIKPGVAFDRISLQATSGFYEAPPALKLKKEINGNKLTLSFDSEGFPEGYWHHMLPGTSYWLNIPYNALDGVDVQARFYDYGGYDAYFKTTGEKIKPTVASTLPAAGAAGVPVDTKELVIQYSEGMQPFMPYYGFDVVDQDGYYMDVDYEHVFGSPTVKLKLNGVLKEGTTYNVTVWEFAYLDLSSNFMSTESYNFSFTTAKSLNVVSTAPAVNATDVALEQNTVTVTFDDVLTAGANFDGITLTDTTGIGPAVTATKEIQGNTLVLTADHLHANGVYAVNIPEGALLNTTNTGNKAHAFTFSTVLDTVAPTVTATTPAAGDDKAALDAPITIEFSEGMTGVDLSRIMLTDADGNVVPFNATLAYGDKVLTLEIPSNLERKGEYTVTIPAGTITDVGGNALTSEYVFDFETTHQKLKVKQ